MIKLPDDPNKEPERLYYDGWVHFFLWGNVLSNTILLSLQLDTIVHSGVLTPLFLSLRVGYLIAFIIAGAMTIISFYTRQKNAIAWATTYIVMVTFNLLEIIALICIHYSNERLAYIINAGIWLMSSVSGDCRNGSYWRCLSSVWAVIPQVLSRRSSTPITIPFIPTIRRCK